MQVLKMFLAFTLPTLFALPIHAQAYPSKPIRFVVGFAPGGGTDVVARVVGQRLAENLSQPVVIENRAGAGGNIATRAVAATQPDGYTILVNSNAYIINPAISKSAGYDPVTDLVPIINAGSTPTVLVTHPSVQASSLKELIALSKSTPLFYSSAGVGTVPFLFIEAMNKREGLKLTHVPYSGAGPALSGVLAGHVPVAALSGETGGLKEFIQAGKLRPIVVTSAKRWSQRSDIPSITEEGFPAYIAASWIGFFAPAGTPKEIVTRLNREISRILVEPEAKAKIGRDWEPNTPEKFAADNKAEFERWAKLANDIGFKAD